jgi:anti-sigma regulatory factor (Ser/Thr protein kinase)
MNESSLRRESVEQPLVRLVFSSESDRLHDFQQWIAARLAETPLTVESAEHLALAASEMASNAMEWGHRFNPDRLVEVACRVDPGAVVVVVRDQGQGFDHAALAPRGWGFGIMLARGLTDDFGYNDAGNEVTLVKRFGASSDVVREP